ncbi:MAG: CAP domain-containing protein [Hyphomicrobiaceae bacterium]|nr:CAP domain-containing protein [Hyphomicrobiaceae bacterium]
MSRVIAPLAVALLVTGCSLSSRSVTASLGDGGSDTATAAAETRRARQGALGGEPEQRQKAATGRNPQMAALDDRAPRGSFDKAPTGALADRNYGATSLNPEQARDLVNAYRKQHGLRPVQLNAQLTEAAKGHSRDLAKWDRISHFGSDGSNPWDRVKRSGYNAKLAAENVGTGQINFDEVLKGWKDSPGHNKNLLLADAVHMGIALVHEQKTEFKTFWTLVLGSPL